MIKSDPQYEYIYLASYSLCTMYIRHVVIGQLTILGPDRLLMSVMENSSLLFSSCYLKPFILYKIQCFACYFDQ